MPGSQVVNFADHAMFTHIADYVLGAVYNFIMQRGGGGVLKW